MQFPFHLMAGALIPAALFPVSPSPAFLIISLLIILLSILLVTLLFVPFHFSLNFSKCGPLIRGSYRIAWLGITLKKKEILPQSAADLLASILKKESAIDEDEGNEGNDRKEEKAKLTAENREEGKVKPDRGAEIEDPKGERDHDTGRSPSPGTLLDAAPAIMNILMDLLKTIVFEKLSCRLCFGLDDPADTATDGRSVQASGASFLRSPDHQPRGRSRRRRPRAPTGRRAGSRLAPIRSCALVTRS